MIFESSKFCSHDLRGELDGLEFSFFILVLEGNELCGTGLGIFCKDSCYLCGDLCNRQEFLPGIFKGELLSKLLQGDLNGLDGTLCILYTERNEGVLDGHKGRFEGAGSTAAIMGDGIAVITLFGGEGNAVSTDVDARYNGGF